MLFKSKYTIFVCLFLFEISSFSQIKDFDNSVIASYDLPEWQSFAFSTIDIIKSKEILVNARGGVLGILSKEWIIKPDPNKLLYAIKQVKDENYYFVVGTGNGDKELRFFDSREGQSRKIVTLQGSFFRFYEFSPTNFLVTIDSNQTKLYQISDKQKLSLIIEIPGIIKDLDHDGHSFLLLINNQIFLLNNETLEYIRLFELDNDPSGVSYLGNELILVSNNKGLLSFPILGDKNASFYKTEEYGMLYRKGGKLFLHSVNSNKLFVLDKTFFEGN